MSPPLTSIAAIIYKMYPAQFNALDTDTSHMGRQGNNIAHLLVKYALNIDNYVT